MPSTRRRPFAPARSFRFFASSRSRSASRRFSSSARLRSAAAAAATWTRSASSAALRFVPRAGLVASLHLFGALAFRGGCRFALCALLVLQAAALLHLLPLGQLAQLRHLPLAVRGLAPLRLGALEIVRCRRPAHR